MLPVTASIVVSILALVGLWCAVLLVVDHFTRWPDLTEDVRPFRCDRCPCSFRDARWLSIHHRAQHPNTFEAS